jgi:putative Mg2+ transporter-C (MgtC) family protein
MISRLLLAAVLGSVIGFERERMSWAAGLRTHMLVCVGATLIMIVSAFGFADILGTPHVELDPSRIAAQVVSGIGFLGAGAILIRGDVVRGLTTAASLWSVAAIGLAVGCGLYTAATAATVIILIILAGIKPLERRYFEARRRREFRLTVAHGSMTMQSLQIALGASSSRVNQFIVQQNKDALDTDDVRIALERIAGGELETIRDQIQKMEGVIKIEDGTDEL